MNNHIDKGSNSKSEEGSLDKELEGNKKLLIKNY